MSQSAASFADLLRSAVADPGIVSAAYRQFHDYSLGNQLLAWGQCLARDLPPGPIATFPRWKALGRCVRKGEKAFTLCQPVTAKRPADADDESGVFTRFIHTPHWFVLAQTDGAEIEAVPIPTWDAARALLSST